MRIEGEAAMFALPFFQSAGRGDLLSWGKKKGPTVVRWEAVRTRKRELAGRGKHDDRASVVSCGTGHKKGQRKSAHLTSAGKKSSLTVMKRNRKRRRIKRTRAKRKHITGRAYNTGHGASKATSKLAMSEDHTSYWGSQRSHCHGKTN